MHTNNISTSVFCSITNSRPQKTNNFKMSTNVPLDEHGRRPFDQIRDEDGRPRQDPTVILDGVDELLLDGLLVTWEVDVKARGLPQRGHLGQTGIQFFQKSVNYINRWQQIEGKLVWNTEYIIQNSIHSKVGEWYQQVAADWRRVNMEHRIHYTEFNSFKSWWMISTGGSRLKES